MQNHICDLFFQQWAELYKPPFVFHVLQAVMKLFDEKDEQSFKARF